MSYVAAIFVGPAGVRAGWRFMAYVAVLIGTTLGLDAFAVPPIMDAMHLSGNGLNARAFLVNEIFEGVAVLIATSVLACCERRRIDSYGFPVRLAFGRLYREGVAIGVAMAGGVALAMLATGTMVVHGLALQGGALLSSAALWLVVMLLVGQNEEYMFRGYPLQALSRGMGFWPAAVLLSLLFGAAHLGKTGENAIDIGNIVLLGLLLCLTVARTGSLWLAAGFHFSFDFMQFFVIGTRNGGSEPIGHLLNVAFPGPAWANGGSLGTEASYFMLPAMALMLVYILIRYPRTTPLVSS
ncbi:MAG TPA: CPBP family intramembrane glutamic endopeptidase [Candidatus Cybelea sp.]|jgi:hypothetical protein|nr:CPBP family intramembrane glutamic endopeptidase [Candidatus Cybelea sp.]